MTQTDALSWLAVDSFSLSSFLLLLLAAIGTAGHVVVLTGDVGTLAATAKLDQASLRIKTRVQFTVRTTMGFCTCASLPQIWKATGVGR